MNDLLSDIVSKTPAIAGVLFSFELLLSSATTLKGVNVVEDVVQATESEEVQSE